MPILISVEEITPAQLIELAERGVEMQVIDVREHEEVEVSMIEGATHIPFAELPSRTKEIDDLKKIVVVCRSGKRSARIAELLVRNGYDAVNLKGGMQAFVAEVDPTIPVA
ncbi:MAG: rhodanese-like domain-containing protein [Armatimonadota bacterium]